MKSLKTGAAFAIATMAAVAMTETPTAAQPESGTEARVAAVSQAMVDNVLRTWRARPQAVAYVTIRKYGLPTEVTDSKLVWQNNGEWKRTTVTREAVLHDFPKPHLDVIEQVIDYHVPVRAIDDLARFDGSIKVDRTAGELSSRCESEEMNRLALNLADDIVAAKKSANQARQSFTEHVRAFLSGNKPEYMARLHVREPSISPVDRDVATLAGAPRRLASPEIQPVSGGASDDAGILAALISMDAHEVEEAKLVLDSTRSDAIRDFAQMLHTDHGQAWRQDIDLGAHHGIRPVQTGAVDSMEQDGAKTIAMLAMLRGPAFDGAFIARAVDEHTKALQTIDSMMLYASNPRLQAQLQNARRVVVSHLVQARALR